METVYLVHHIYEIDGDEEVKYIGVFSSLDKANKAIESLKDKPGFVDHPIDCFEISHDKLDDYGWKEGFARVP